MRARFLLAILDICIAYRRDCRPILFIARAIIAVAFVYCSYRDAESDSDLFRTIVFAESPERRDYRHSSPPPTKHALPCQHADVIIFLYFDYVGADDMPHYLRRAASSGFRRTLSLLYARGAQLF